MASIKELLSNMIGKINGKLDAPEVVPTANQQLVTDADGVVKWMPIATEESNESDSTDQIVETVEVAIIDAGGEYRCSSNLTKGELYLIEYSGEGSDDFYVFFSMDSLAAFASTPYATGRENEGKLFFRPLVSGSLNIIAMMHAMTIRVQIKKIDESKIDNSVHVLWGNPDSSEQMALNTTMPVSITGYRMIQVIFRVRTSTFDFVSDYVSPDDWFSNANHTFKAANYDIPTVVSGVVTMKSLRATLAYNPFESNVIRLNEGYLSTIEYSTTNIDGSGYEESLDLMIPHMIIGYL